MTFSPLLGLRGIRVLSLAFWRKWRSTHRHHSCRDYRAALRIRLWDLAAARARYGYERLYILLRRGCWRVNKKLEYRLYVKEGLQLGAKTRHRHNSCQAPQEQPCATNANESWSIDVLADQPLTGERFRILTIVDNFSREGRTIRAG